MSDADLTTNPETLLAHGDFVRSIARSLLWDEHAAEDVVQETWLAALGAPAGASRGWLAAVARNQAIKRLRGDRRRAAREAAASRPEGVPSDVEVRERERLRRSVVDEVLALPEPYRATVLLRFFDDLPPREVARRMGVPAETVRTRTRRAIEMLRARLDARHRADRSAFCAALAAWGGPRGGGALPVAPLAGGLLMGTKSVAVGVAVVAAGVVAFLLWPRGGAAIAPDLAVVPPPAAAAAPAPRPKPAPDPVPDEPVQAPAPRPPVVTGRIVDRQGRPAAGMNVWVAGPGLGTTDASGARPTGNAVVLTTDADGRYTATLPSAAKYNSTPVANAAFEPEKGAQREFTAPDEKVDFVVDRHPTATLVVTAFDADAGAPVAGFDCTFVGKARGFALWHSDGGRVEAVVRLAAAAGDTVKATVTTGGVSASRDVAVRDGERVEVRVELRRGDAVTGRVVDVAGRPLVNALVFFGEEDVARGDEPFKPFDEKRVREGVRTGADGRFELRGKGRWITMWHPDASPVTVATASAADVSLPARGTIRGVLRGADGKPLPATKVFVDRVRETMTDAEGRFVFDGVEAGTRGLSLTGGKPKAYVAVRVTAGQATEVELRPGIPTVRVAWPGRTNLGRFVALLPLDAVGSMALGQPDGGAAVAPDVLPGRYLLLAEGGAVATVDVSGAEATALVGKGEIVVRAKAKTRVYVVPAGAGYLARLMAGRMAGAGVPENGEQRFTGLAPGRYEVGVERDGVRTVVDVADRPVETTIE
jgi:RNA polymerase sigma-70 factor (ECF subfamily)